MDILTALLSGASTVLFWLLPLCAAILTGMCVILCLSRLMICGFWGLSFIILITGCVACMLIPSAPL